jgi:arginine repressor
MQIFSKRDRENVAEDALKRAWSETQDEIREQLKARGFDPSLAKL